MDRLLMDSLIRWKDTEPHRRKPLIIRGARQVGKTWLMQEFGRTCFSNTAYINFERERRLHQLLEESISPDQLIPAFGALTGEKIVPGKTLIILDEIQEAPRALAALKYFQEERPEYPIVCAGSLLGVALHEGTSFPVGKVSFLDLYPLNFREFLRAIHQDGLCDLLESGNEKPICAMKSSFVDALRSYYLVGGMPEAVMCFAESMDYLQVREIQNHLLDYYRQDFSKHAPIRQVPRLNQTWNSIPAQLSKENRKYIYGQVVKGARAKDFELALQWLSDCGLIHLVNRVSKPGIPLKSYEELSSFKVYMNDVGLLAALGELPVSAVVDGNRLFEEFKGALTEQYVLQQLISDLEIRPYYYSADNSRGELDFLIQQESDMIPVEVKAAENLRAKSLKVFVEKYGLSRGIRISMSDFRKQEWLVNLPLYAFMVLWKKTVI